MTNLIRRALRLAAAGAVATALLIPAGPAGAAPDPKELDQHRAQVVGRIDYRLESLGRTTRQVTEADELTRRHRAALQAMIADQRSVLTRLKTRAQAERTHRGLRAYADDLEANQPRFALIRPKSRLVIAADLDSATATSLTEVRGRQVGQVAKLTGTRVNTRPAERALATLRISVDRAQRLLRGQADTALKLTDKARLDRIQQTLSAAHREIRTAMAAARTVRSFLEAHPRPRRR